MNAFVNPKQLSNKYPVGKWLFEQQSFPHYSNNCFYKGTVDDWLKSYEEYKTQQECIIHAACIDDKADMVFVVGNPGRHHHIVHWMTDLGIRQTTLTNQGFLTNHGRYVDRKEALRVAIRGNQLLKPRAFYTHDLFSEDVW